LVRDLAEEGHDITVICGSSSYASADEAGGRPAANIVSIKTLPFGQGQLMRVLSYASCYLGAMLRALFAAKPDLIVSMTTPPLLSVLGSLVKRLRGSRHFIWEMDLYPDIALDLKVMRPGALVTRIIGWLADGSRNHADGIIALGPCMKERLIDRGIEEDKIHIAPNWADGVFFRPTHTVSISFCRRRTALEAASAGMQ
jgi:glycosyltransferase involved in cell wall biosynthesis